jgi:HSP20 family protein
MNTLVKRNNQRELANPWLRDFLNVENVFDNWLQPFNNALPAVNISEDEKAYAVDVVAPGYTKDDFKVHIEDDILTISAENKKESADGTANKKYNRREYSYNSFTRSFRLPDNAKDDAIDAAYQDGILKLRIEKTENPVKATKEIHVN